MPIAFTALLAAMSAIWPNVDEACICLGGQFVRADPRELTAIYIRYSSSYPAVRTKANNRAGQSGTEREIGRAAVGGSLSLIG